MKRSCIVVTLAALLAAVAPASAQTPSQLPVPAGAATPSPQGQAPAKPVAVRPNRASKANTDARPCLELTDNLQIIACAEKYR